MFKSTPTPSIRRKFWLCASAFTLIASSANALASELWLFTERDFTGSYTHVSRSEPALPTGSARSIRVSTGIWEACTGQNFTGECRRLTPGDYREVLGRRGEAILSVRDVTYSPPPSSVEVGIASPRLQLFDGRDFKGRTLTVDRSMRDLSRQF